MVAAGFKVNFGAADRGVSLEDFNGKPIWDAAWGESDYDEEEEDEDEDEDDAPWGQANKRAEGILQLPEQDTLKEKEEVSNAQTRTALSSITLSVLKSLHKPIMCQGGKYSEDLSVCTEPHNRRSSPLRQRLSCQLGSWHARSSRKTNYAGRGGTSG